MYDYIKGYKGPIDSLPKHIKEVVKERMLADGSITEQELKELMFEIDVYMEVDIKNFYKKQKEGK